MEGNSVSKALIYKVNEVAEMIGKPASSVRNEIRSGRLKATKSGVEYLIDKKEVDRYLGIETSDESLKKDLEIEKLKGQVKSLQTKIEAFESVANSLNNIIGM